MFDYPMHRYYMVPVSGARLKYAKITPEMGTMPVHGIDTLGFKRNR